MPNSALYPESIYEKARNHFILPDNLEGDSLYDENGKLINPEEYAGFLARILNAIENWEQKATELYGEKILEIIDNSAFKRHILTAANGPNMSSYIHKPENLSFWSINRMFRINSAGSPIWQRLLAVTLGTWGIFSKSLFTQDPNNPNESLAAKLFTRLIFGAPISVSKSFLHDGTLGAWDKETGKFNLNFWNNICAKNSLIAQSQNSGQLNKEVIFSSIPTTTSSCPVSLPDLTTLEWNFMTKISEKNNEIKCKDTFDNLLYGGGIRKKQFKPD